MASGLSSEIDKRPFFCPECLSFCSECRFFCLVCVFLYRRPFAYFVPFALFLTRCVFLSRYRQRVRHAWLFHRGSMLACAGARALALCQGVDGRGRLRPISTSANLSRPSFGCSISAKIFFAQWEGGRPEEWALPERPKGGRPKISLFCFPLTP